MKKISHILLFAPYYPPYVGGIANYIEELAKSLADHGIKVTIYAPRFNWLPNLPHGQATPKIIYYPAFELISSFPVPNFLKPAFWRSYNQLKAKKYDAVISQTRFFLSSLLALWYAKRRQIPLVHIEHGSGPVVVENSLVRWLAGLYDMTIGGWLFRAAFQNVAISEPGAQFVKKYTGRKPPVIYRGLDLKRYEKILLHPQILQKKGDKIVITWAGRLCYSKGLDRLLAALDLLLPELKKNCLILCIGDGINKKDLQKTYQHLPIEWISNCERTEVIGYLKASDIFLHGSRPGGGLATSLLEAMLCQTAVVASHYEGGSDLIQDEINGLLVDEATPQSFAKAIERLIKDEALRKKLGKAAGQYVRENFNWPTATRQLLEVINNLNN